MSKDNSKVHKVSALSDPRLAGGDVAGPGGPATRNGVVVDMTRGVLLDGTMGLVVSVTRDGVETDDFGLMLEGRINKTAERSRVLYLTDLDGLVGMAAECVALAGRAGVPLEQFMDQFAAHLEVNHEAYLADLPENER